VYPVWIWIWFEVIIKIKLEDHATFHFTLVNRTWKLSGESSLRKFHCLKIEMLQCMKLTLVNMCEHLYVPIRCCKYLQTIEQLSPGLAHNVPVSFGFSSVGLFLTFSPIFAVSFTRWSFRGSVFVVLRGAGLPKSLRLSTNFRWDERATQFTYCRTLTAEAKNAETRGEKKERPGKKQKMHDSCAWYFAVLRRRTLKTFWDSELVKNFI